MAENEENIVAEKPSVDRIVSEVNSNLDSILKNNGNLLSQKTQDEFKKLKEEKAAATKKSLNEDGFSDIKIEETPVEKEEVTSDEQELVIDEKNENQEEPEKKNVLGISLGKKNKVAETLSIDKVEDILPAIKKQYGIELKDIKELPKFFESVNKFRADSQKLVEVQEEANQFKSLFENLDPVLFDAVRAFYDGKDYTSIINNKPAFNLSLDVEKQDIKKLVSHYYKDRFTSEQLETIGLEDQDPAIGIAIESSKDKYNIEKQKRDNDIAAYDNQAKEGLKSFNSSVEGSIKHLEMSFPEVENAAKNRIKQTMSGGAKKIVSIFCNPDGTFKPGAAEQLLLAQEGKSLIFEMMEAAGRMAETKVNEEFVSRGDGKKQRSGGGTGSDISLEAKTKLDGLAKLKVKQN